MQLPASVIFLAPLRAFIQRHAHVHVDLLQPELKNEAGTIVTRAKN